LLQPNLYALSELYVVERHSGQSKDGSSVDAMVRLWRYGAPVSYQPLKEIELGGRQSVSFSVAAGHPDDISSEGKGLPVGWRPLGRSLQSLRSKGWKAYLGSDVLTLSYGRDCFFSVDLAKGFDKAKDLIKLAFMQMPPKSKQVCVFDESDVNLSGQGWLVPLLQELGLSVRPLRLAEPLFWLPSKFLTSAPRGLVSGLVVLSLLLVVQMFWSPLGTPTPTAPVVGSGQERNNGAGAVGGKGVIRFLNQVAQALLSSGTFEIDRIWLQSSGGSGEYQLEFDLVRPDFGEPLNLKPLIEQLKQIPGVLNLKQKEGSDFRFVAQVSSQGLAGSNSTNPRKSVTSLSPEKLTSLLYDHSRRAALAIADPKRIQTGWRIEAIDQPTVSAIRFLELISVDVLSEDSFTTVEIKRSGAAGLVSLHLELAL
jgi:hypothetical protein